VNPALELRLIARVRARVGTFIEAGEVPEGTRRVIPITGGTADGPEITGEVVGLGADWNLLRSDGSETVSARYLIRTDDGVTLTVENVGVIAERPAGRLGITALRIEAPNSSRYAWLNQAVLAGSLSTEHDGGEIVVLLEYWNVEATPALGG
jgi:hypothetical protein